MSSSARHSSPLLRCGTTMSYTSVFGKPTCSSKSNVQSPTSEVRPPQSRFPPRGLRFQLSDLIPQPCPILHPSSLTPLSGFRFQVSALPPHFSFSAFDNRGPLVPTSLRPSCPISAFRFHPSPLVLSLSGFRFQVSAFPQPHLCLSVLICG